MSNRPSGHVENNFTGGLKTEYTGLNFPENACTDADNCTFSLTGEVSSRYGINYEANYSTRGINIDSIAKCSYKWNNVGGDGTTRLLVEQLGNNLYFYRSTDATVAAPLSTTLLASTVNINAFYVGGPATNTLECDYTDGNGYLFVFHPSCSPFYVSYSAGTLTATKIDIKVRDFNGIPETGVATDFRPPTLSTSHQYNLVNQGWTAGGAWMAVDITNTVTIGTGSKVFTVASGIATVTNGDLVQIHGAGLIGNPVMTGTVTSYVGTALTVNVFSSVGGGGSAVFSIVEVNQGYIDAWLSAAGNYPSNGDIWWLFKNASGNFDPATTLARVTINTGPAINGHFVVDAFNQQRSATSGIPGLTTTSTSVRPRTGTWFLGRIWYTGVDASFAASGTAPYYSWTENIYFSQTIVGTNQFGYCYQTHDPTSQDFADLLPTDGGVITIQGAGSIYKIFPIENGLLVHAANGIWFITGNQGIGFTATDYTITKISAIQTSSSTSFINVLGYPMFWNQEGIYTVAPNDRGKLEVTNLCFGTILSFYEDIPVVSKRFARGDYDPINFTISWLFRSTEESGIANRYHFDRVLNFKTPNKAFYPYTIASGNSGSYVHDLKFINDPGGDFTAAPAAMKYFAHFGADTAASTAFAEENDATRMVDFYSQNNAGFPYESYFITGYKLYGQAITKFQPVYFQIFSRTDEVTGYKIQGIWDYANNTDSGRYSETQLVTNALSNFGVVYKRHRIRGRGLALQLKVSSATGLPFRIIGWSSLESVNAGM